MIGLKSELTLNHDHEPLESLRQQRTKSGNEETGFFNTKGRISRSAFFKRVALALLIYLSSHIALETGLFSVFGVRFYLFFDTLHSFFLPLGLIAFLFIQGA